MPSAEEIAPLEFEVVVPVRPTMAFVGFTAQMGEWWDPMLTPDPATYQSIEIDPNGQVAMVHEQDKYAWGEVTAWEPEGHYAQTFWLGHDQAAPSRLDVTFTEEGASTRVRLVHAGWGPDTEDVRAKYANWDDLLLRYAAHVS